MDRRNTDAAIRKNPFAKNKTFPADIATMLRNADTLLAACSHADHADHAAALKTQGWIAKDNADFTAAIGTAKDAFKDHLDKKADSKDETNDTTQQANDLYLGLLAIQNAANNEHDEDDPATRGIRAKYRLDLFPPTAPETKEPVPTPIPTPPAP